MMCDGVANVVIRLQESGFDPRKVGPDTPVSCDGQLIPAVGIEPTRAFPPRGF